MCFTAVFYWNKSLEQYHSSFVRLLYLPWVLPSSEHLLSLLNPAFTFIMLWHWGKFPLPLLSVSLAQTGSNTGTALRSCPEPSLLPSSVLSLVDLLFTQVPNSELCLQDAKIYVILNSLPRHFSISLLFIFLLASLPIFQFQFVQIMSLPLDYSWTYALPNWKPDLTLAFLCPSFPHIQRFCQILLILFPKTF